MQVGGLQIIQFMQNNIVAKMYNNYLLVDLLLTGETLKTLCSQVGQLVYSRENRSPQFYTSTLFVRYSIVVL